MHTWKPKECLSQLDNGEGSAEFITRILTRSSLIHRLSCSRTYTEVKIRIKSKQKQKQLELVCYKRRKKLRLIAAIDCCLTHWLLELFCQKCVFWTFWWNRVLRHLGSDVRRNQEKVTYVFRLFDFWIFSPFPFLLFFSFCCSDWLSTGLACG